MEGVHEASQAGAAKLGKSCNFPLKHDVGALHWTSHAHAASCPDLSPKWKMQGGLKVDYPGVWVPTKTQTRHLASFFLSWGQGGQGPGIRGTSGWGGRKEGARVQFLPYGGYKPAAGFRSFPLSTRLYLSVGPGPLHKVSTAGPRIWPLSPSLSLSLSLSLS